MDTLEISRDRILAFTMPGFGTTTRTRHNALALMRGLGVKSREVDIRPLCLAEMQALGHRPFGIDLDGIGVDELTGRLRALPVESRQDLVFENVQARMRTSVLMNAGFVIGTGDVSELALGWCTYNGDHMSMYNPNVSIPKTLVKFLVAWAADNEFEGEVQGILHDIVATDISPELLPAGEEGRSVNPPRASIGPYELQDFFLYYFSAMACRRTKSCTWPVRHPSTRTIRRATGTLARGIHSALLCQSIQAILPPGRSRSAPSACHRGATAHAQRCRGLGLADLARGKQGSADSYSKGAGFGVVVAKTSPYAKTTQGLTMAAADVRGSSEAEWQRSLQPSWRRIQQPEPHSLRLRRQ